MNYVIIWAFMETRIFSFVDNSNIFIEAQKSYGKLKSNRDQGRQYRLDFGKLFNHISGKRGKIFFTTRSKNPVSYPKLYGSEPPKMDSLWKFLGGMGVDVNVFKRNAFNKEKQVDTALVWDVADLIFRTKYKGDNKKHVIAIAGGDRDFLKLYHEGIKFGYQVEFYCWEHSAAGEIKRLPTFHNLTPMIEKLGFIERYKFEHNFGEIDWSKVVPYD
jgi:hypothetical protein